MKNFQVGKPVKVKLISGLLCPDEGLLTEAKKYLAKFFGKIDMESPIVPFDLTDYYNEEMGEGIKRQYISFDKLISPEYIAAIKRQTIKIEKKFSSGVKRKINIDPGFVSLDKMVLATTKDATYRIYIGKGIYAQSTLYFKDGSFHPWPWTYEDYKSEMSIKFFSNVRDLYKKIK